MTLKTSLPRDSLIHYWCAALSITEMPHSWQVLTGLTIVGALLERCVFFDQEEFRIWPAQSLLLVGPSGIGKDTAIDRVEEAVRTIGGERWAGSPTRIIGGRTIEKVWDAMVELGDPASCVILAP